MGPGSEPSAVAFPRGNKAITAAINWQPTSDSVSRHESAPIVRQRKRKPEHLGRRARPHAVRPDQLRRALPGQPPEVRVVGADLLVARQPARASARRPALAEAVMEVIATGRSAARCRTRPYARLRARVAHPMMRGPTKRAAREGEPILGAGRAGHGGGQHRFRGIDAAKAKHAVAVAEPGRQGEVRYLEEIEASPEAFRKLITHLAARHGNCMSAARRGQPAMACTGRSLASSTPARWWRPRSSRAGPATG